jgi:hypothetical protein
MTVVAFAALHVLPHEAETEGVSIITGSDVEVVRCKQVLPVFALPPLFPRCVSIHGHSARREAEPIFRN